MIEIISQAQNTASGKPSSRNMAGGILLETTQITKSPMRRKE